MGLQEFSQMPWIIQGGFISLLLILAGAVCYLVKQNTIAAKEQSQSNKELTAVLTKMSMQLDQVGQSLRDINQRLDNLESKHNKCRDPTHFQGDSRRSDGSAGGA